MAAAIVVLVLATVLPTLIATQDCSCKFAGQTLPAAAAEDAGNPLYGTSCEHKWDSFPGTKYYKSETECPDKCEQGCNYLNLEWCYVEKGCPNSEAATIEGLDVAFSYDACGNPYCWNQTWNDGCPGGEGCGDSKCKCKFEGGTLPPETALTLGNPLYGTSCSTAWDSFPGTQYYKNDTVCPKSHMCEKGCNFLHLEWCYVEGNCAGLEKFPTTVEGAGDLFYSYDVCHNPYCWNDFEAWNPGCPGGEGCHTSTCSKAKDAYKTQGCCGMPDKEFAHARR